MSKKKTKKSPEPDVKPCADYKVVSTRAMEALDRAMYRIMYRIEKTLADPRYLELARDVAAHLYEETCNPRVFACDQAEEE